jgi:hypothetical protein
VNHNESLITTFRHRDQVITHIRGCREDSNQYTSCKKKPDNMMYAWSLGSYIQQPFAKSLRGRIRSSTPGMKSSFHSDRLALPLSWATSFSLWKWPWSSSYGSTKKLHKLLGLWDPINLACVSIIQCLFHRAQHDVVLNQHRRGLPPRSLEYLLIHSQPSHPVILSTFPSGDTNHS